MYLGYEFYDGWIQKLGLSNLKLQVSMRDVFRASSIKSERGISYPLLGVWKQDYRLIF